MMHGFPDNLQIYDRLIPYLVAAGRRVVTFDFLGYGASEKPAGANYSFRQQLGDLEAVLEALHLEKIVPVGSEVTVYVRPLQPGRYNFFDDFHRATQGYLVVP